MSNECNPNPRKVFDEAVRYAVQISNSCLQLLQANDIQLDGLRYLELGPGADFAPQLVLASHGVRVTLADKYLSSWDPNFHPEFYRVFLAQWPGRNEAVKAALNLVPEPAEHMPSIGDSSIDFVLSNAVLEHVDDLSRVAPELARLTRVGGIHAHQVDFRDHGNFDRPLDHLLRDPKEFQRHRIECQASCGTTVRMPEMLEEFSKYFWLWTTECSTLADPGYMAELMAKLPGNNPYKSWPVQILRILGARLWFVRKAQNSRASRSPFRFR